MKSAIHVILTSAIFVSISGGVIAQEECYEFTGQTEECQLMFAAFCDDGDGKCDLINGKWKCIRFEINPVFPTPTWDGYEGANEGYTGEGNNVLCYEWAKCKCVPIMMEDPDCAIDEESWIQEWAEVVSIDINLVCPEVM